MAKSVKQKAKNVVLPHSQAKLDLYEKYLLRYLNVLSFAGFCPKINLFDIYCGVGIYEDGKMGSPLITNKCIKETNQVVQRSKLQLKPITVNINDYDLEKIQNVKSLIEADRVGNCKYEFFNEDADEMLTRVASMVSAYGRAERNLIFIDPYGYSQIHSDKIYNLVKNKQTEVILFLPVMQMYRFTEAAITDPDDKACYENLRRFIFSFFPSSHKIHAENVANVFEFIHEIKLALSFDKTFYTCSHYIQREKGNYYALFFITSNMYGLDKMVEAKWALDPVNGEGFDQKKPSNQGSLFDADFQEQDNNMRLDLLRDILLGCLEGGKVLSNVEIYEIALLNEFKPNQARVKLQELLKNRKIQIFDSNNNPIENIIGLDYTHYKNKNRKVFCKKI